MPPRRASGGNQERGRKKGSIIKLPDNYNFMELFPQLKILLAQQIPAVQTAPSGRGLILALSPASFLALPLSGGDKHRWFFVNFFRGDAAAGIRCASKKSVSDSDT